MRSEDTDRKNSITSRWYNIIASCFSITSCIRGLLSLKILTLTVSQWVSKWYSKVRNFRKRGCFLYLGVSFQMNDQTALLTVTQSDTLHDVKPNLWNRELFIWDSSSDPRIGIFLNNNTEKKHHNLKRMPMQQRSYEKLGKSPSELHRSIWLVGFFYLIVNIETP